MGSQGQLAMVLLEAALNPQKERKWEPGLVSRDHHR